MRILFTIPHYFNPKGGGAYGSLRAQSAPRVAALTATIYSLHATFGPRQGLLCAPIVRSNTAAEPIGVVVCTTGDRHVVRELKLPSGSFQHVATKAEPMYLGFECHQILRRNLGSFDWFCYLEDDIAVLDPLFFQKLEWFNRVAGDEAVLQPNRCEMAVAAPWHKLYVDGTLARPEWSERWQDANDRRVIEAEALGFPVKLQRVNNPHSGCFFLNARQMARWAEQDDFMVREPRFVGPLETAATYGIMRHFRVYKPARENAGFLEVRHMDNRYLGVKSNLKRPPAPAKQS